MPIGPIAIAASADDASESAGTVSITANPLANCDTTGVWNAWRFTGINIPAGATITQAYLTVRFTSSTLDEPDVTIYGLDVSSPAQFTTAASSISTRTRTTASVNWSNSNAGTGDVNTADISTIVQELVDSYAPYSSGVLGFCMTTRAADSARDTSVTSYDGSTTNCARLYIVYTLMVSVSDTVSSITDSPVCAVVSNDRIVSVSDAVAVTDAVHFYPDNIIVSESVSVSVVSAGGTLSVNKSDTIGTSETVSVSVGTPQVSKSETVGTAESVTASVSAPQVNKNETMGITESVSALIGTSQVSKSETVGISETITASVSTSQVSKSETIGTAENTAIVIDASQIGKSENVATSEFVSASVSASQVSVLDSVGVAEAVSATISDPGTPIIDIDHETNDLTQYTSTVTDGGDLAVTAGAALAGTGYGLSVTVDDTTAIYGRKTFTAPASYLRMRFYLDVNSLSMTDGSYFIFNPIRDIFDNIVLYFQIYRSGTSYLIRTMTVNDAYDNNFIDYETLTDAPHYLEIYIARAASTESNDGVFRFYIDDVEASHSVTNLDNYTVFGRFASVDMGLTAISGSVSGTFYLDELIVNDTGEYIGPLAGSVNPSVSDPIGLTESHAESVGTSQINVSDSTGVTESASVSIVAVGTQTVAVSDTVAQSESVAAVVSTSSIAKSESIGVTDAPSVNVGVAGTLSASVSETIGLTENVLATVGTPAVSKSETIGITDTPTVSVGAAGTLSVSKSETVGLTESTVAAVGTSLVSKSETIALSESASALFGLSVYVVENVATTESNGRAVSTSQANVNEAVTVGESSSLLLSEFFAGVTDTVTVTENVSLYVIQEITGVGHAPITYAQKIETVYADRLPLIRAQETKTTYAERVKHAAAQVLETIEVE